MMRNLLRAIGKRRRVCFESIGALITAVALTGCPSHLGLRTQQPLNILRVEQTTRPATLLERAIHSPIEDVEVTMDVLHVSIEIGGAPPDFVVVTLADSTGAVHHRQRFGEVRLGRQTLEVELVDARGKRPPPGLYLLAIVPHGRDGLPSGGDEWEVRLDSESA